MQRKGDKERFAALDAFRGISALMIILFHSRFFQSSEPFSFFQNASIFVDFFFILSGFVMAHSYGKRIPGEISFKRFVWLRLARIYPLHLFMLLVWLPFVLMKIYLYHHGTGDVDPAQTQNFFTFIQNLLLLQGFDTSTSWNYPSWSIGVEFYTYLLFFAVILLVSYLPVSASMVLFGVLAAGSYLVYDMTYGEVYWFQNMLRSVGEFFLGVLLYHLYQRYPYRDRHTLRVNAVEMTLMLLTFFSVSAITSHEEFRNITVLLFGVIVYVFSASQGGFLHTLLTQKAFRFLGERSYSIYMTHAIIIVIVYEALVRVFHLVPGGIEYSPKGIVSDMAWLFNLLLVLIVIVVSSWTYRHVELRAQHYLKARFKAA